MIYNIACILRLNDVYKLSLAEIATNVQLVTRTSVDLVEFMAQLVYMYHVNTSCFGCKMAKFADNIGEHDICGIFLAHVICSSIESSKKSAETQELC